MEQISVFDSRFAPYGQVLEGYDFTDLIRVLEESTPCPEDGTVYVPSEPALEALPIFGEVRDRGFGGMPIQLGMCWGYNTKLNCLEYHRDSEFNLGTENFILLLARQDEICDGVLDTAKVKAFWVPAGTLIECYATTLHYAPCHTDPNKGFQVLIALPKGTNTDKPAITPKTPEDQLLWARNKWLLAHPESSEAAAGAAVRLEGENIDIANLI